jgi:CBS domain-containing protein
MSLERFCRKATVTCLASDTVTAAAIKMREGHVGSLVVVDEQYKPIGILTDRDVVCRVVADQRSPDATRVGEVMSFDLQVAHATDKVDQALFAMQSKGVRRLPLVDVEGRLAGIVSLDDMLVLLSAELGQTTHTVRSNLGP